MRRHRAEPNTSVSSQIAFARARPVLALLAVTVLVCVHVAVVKSPETFRVYTVGAEHALSGENPYAAEPGLDFFKYSPWAALLIAPFAALPEGLGLFLFLVLQCALFYWGFARFSRAAGHDVAASRPMLLVAIASVALDLTLTIQNGQVNAGVLALMLLGAASYAEAKPVRSGLLLSLAADLKLFPVTLGLCLLTRFERRFWASFFAGLALWFLAPAIFVGLERNFELHQQWLELLLSDGRRSRPMLDIGTFLHLHFGLDGDVRTPLAIAAGLALGLSAYEGFRRHRDRLVNRFLLPLNGLYVVLFSYLSESPTSVLATPAIFLLGARALETGSRLAWVAWAASLVLVGLPYTDALPPPAADWARDNHVKTAGYLYLLGANVWLACVYAHRGFGVERRVAPRLIGSESDARVK